MFLGFSYQDFLILIELNDRIRIGITFNNNMMLLFCSLSENLTINQISSMEKKTLRSGVEMIGIINKKGRMTESRGFDSLSMPKDKKEMFLMKIALRASMQSDFDEELGKVNYCMTQRGGRKFISVPAPNNNTILTVIKNNCDHEELVNNIIQTMNSNQSEILFKEGEH